MFEPGQSFDYALVLGGVKSHSYLKLMEWEAEKAAQRLYQTGKITVVVQDQGSIHTCQAAKAQQGIWERLGLYIFFLLKYCSEMNRIETEWLRLKADELAGQMFEENMT